MGLLLQFLNFLNVFHNTIISKLIVKNITTLSQQLNESITMDACEIPVLILTYKRLESVISIIEILRNVKTSTIYFANNAPKTSSDVPHTNSVRSLVNSIDWDCNIYKVFKDNHLNVQDSIVSSINTFFENVSFGIILEDDCIPTEDFFYFVADAYNQSMNSKYIFISGNNFDNQNDRFPRLTKYCHIWGWAASRQVWNLYDTKLNDLNTFYIFFRWFLFNSRFCLSEKIYWYSFFLKVKNKHIVTWDYQLIYMMWKYNLYAVIPQFNLVLNVGFSPDATNSNDINSPHYTNEIGKYHPSNLQNLQFHHSYDNEVSKIHYQITMLKAIYSITKTIIRIIFEKLNIPSISNRMRSR